MNTLVCSNGAMIADATGLIDGCTVVNPVHQTIPVMVSNPNGDLRRWAITWTAGPDPSYTFRLSRSAATFALDYTPTSGGFASRAPHEIDLKLRDPVAAASVEVTWRGKPLPPASLDCGYVVLGDATGLVESCETSDPGPGQVDGIQVSAGRRHPNVLRVEWMGSVCDKPYAFDFRRTADGFALDGTLGPNAVCFAMAPVKLELRMYLVDVVDAAAISATMT